MKLSIPLGAWLAMAGHFLLWGVIGVRLAVGASQKAGPQCPPVNTSRSPRGAWTPTLLTGITMFAFYPLLVLSLAEPASIGPELLPRTLLLQAAGSACLLAGLALVGWSYATLHSFRLLPQIDPGHQLCTHGPYAKVRHPVYLGINIFYIGCFLLLPDTGILLQTIANLVAFDLRARVEEDVLIQAFGEAYKRYEGRTHRLIPGIY